MAQGDGQKQAHDVLFLKTNLVMKMLTNVDTNMLTNRIFQMAA